jgi:hypothetical protein
LKAFKTPKRVSLYRNSQNRLPLCEFQVDRRRYELAISFWICIRISVFSNRNRVGDCGEKLFFLLIVGMGYRGDAKILQEGLSRVGENMGKMGIGDFWAGSGRESSFLGYHYR